MPKRLKAALTARSTVLVLLVLLAAAMTVAGVVPQGTLDDAGGAAPGAGTVARPGRVVAALGLDHVFSTPWFAALALLFVSALAVSTLDQLRLARARMNQPPSEPGEPGTPSGLSEEAIRTVLRGEGYRRLSGAGGLSRHVRHWQGYWGSFLLHAGMTLAVLFSVTYVLTENRAKVRVVSGRERHLSAGSYATRRGLLARAAPLPEEIDLYRVEPTFGANDQLVDLASRLVFTDAQGGSREVRVAVNDYQDYRGLVVYQLVKWGNAFFLEVDDGGAQPSELVLEIAAPEKRGAASYLTRALDGGWSLKAKYYPSADRKEILPSDPQLVLRLYEGERLAGEAALQEGQTARLGPVGVRLERVGWWTEILFEGSLGTAGIFAGFAVLLLGGVLTFFAVPREVVVRSTPDGQVVHWRATRFPDMYREERDRVLSRCSGGRPS